MKIKKFLKLIVCFILLLNVVKADLGLLLDGQQIDYAKSLYSEVTSRTTEDPCDPNIGVFKCELMYPEDPNSKILTITRIDLMYKGGESKTITTTLSKFKNATFIYIDDGITFDQSFFTKLPDFFWGNATIHYDRLIQRVPEYMQLPYNTTKLIFNNIGVPLTQAFFNTSSNLLHMEILNPEPGFAFPDPFPPGSELRTFVTKMTTYAKFPLYPFSNLRKLVNCTILVDNDMSYPGFVGFDLPMFNDHKTLEELNIKFTVADNARTYFFSNVLRLENIKTLKRFTVQGRGFRLNTELDLSKIARGAYISIAQSCDSLFQCPTSKCIHFPPDAELSVTGCDFPMSKVNLKNLKSLSISGNKIQESLPYDSSIDFTTINKWSLINNKYTGSIPNEYCYIRQGSLNVGGNLLSGTVPTCFQCAGGNSTPSAALFPNSFTDFSPDTFPSTCPTFAFESNNFIAKTDGSSKITVKGADFGWDVTVSSGTPTISVKVPNREIVISIPAGLGKGLEVQGNFTYGNKIKLYTFKYDYEKPVVTSYTYTEVKDSDEQSSEVKKLFTVVGSGFNFLDTNDVYINNLKYVGPVAVSNGEHNKIVFDVNPTSGLEIGKEFSVYVNINGEISNIGTYLLFDNIKAENVSILRLNTTGGDVTLKGFFATTDISLIKVRINSVPCNIYESTIDTLKIAYPAVPGVSSYPLEITVGGLKFSQLVEYVEAATKEPLFYNSSNDSNSILSLSKLSIIILSSSSLLLSIIIFNLI